MQVMRSRLPERYPPSDPCSCHICKTYCRRPGWWTLEEAYMAMEAGLGNRMMLEMSPELKFGILSPAFHGCEGNFALQEFSNNGCNFLRMNRCELHGTPYQPLECRFCHHDRIGLGSRCHRDLEFEWDSPQGKMLIDLWMKKVQFPFRDLYNVLIRRREIIRV